MKKPIIILAAVFLALIGVATAVLVMITRISNTLDQESKAFVDAAIPAIVSDWDVEEIRKRASPEYDAMAQYEEVQHGLDLLRGLGELEEYRGSTGRAKMAFLFPDGVFITAAYDAIADFESGSAEIQLQLIKHGDQWQLLGFTINPEEPQEGKDII